MGVPMIKTKRCEGVGDDDLGPLVEGEVVYTWNDYNECWMGIDQDGRVAYTPGAGAGELPGCADPASANGSTA